MTEEVKTECGGGQIMDDAAETVQVAENLTAEAADTTVEPAATGKAKKSKRVKHFSANKKLMRINAIKLIVLTALVAGAILLYLLIKLPFGNSRDMAFAINRRIPLLIAILIASFAIGAAAVVFQTIIGTRIVTPCLLGMNSLYTLTHTFIVVIFGTASVFFTNNNLAFAVDLVIMTVVAVFVYGFMFKKTKHNILYILLIGTVLGSLFGSIQTSLVRTMDPNAYDKLLETIVASFENINTEIMIFAVVLLGAVMLLLLRDLRLLDVMALGKNQAINLGVDYDKSTLRLLVGVTVYIAIATAMVGPISFLGLITANLAREFFRTFKHWQLVIGSTLFGLIVLVIGEVLVEHAFNMGVPVSVFVSLIGGVYFLYLLLRKKTV